MSTRLLSHPPATGANVGTSAQASRTGASTAEFGGVAPRNSRERAVVPALAATICKRLLIATAIAAVGAVVSASPARDSFGPTFGAFLIVLGFATMIAAPVIGTYIRSSEIPVFVTERLGPPRAETESGHPTLTGFGAFLLVSVPLIASGALLI